MRPSTRHLIATGRLAGRKAARRPPLATAARRKDGEVWAWLLALSGATLLHAFVIWPLFADFVGATKETKESTQVRSVALSSAAFDQNRRVEIDIKKTPPPPKEEDVKKPKDTQKPPGQVVKIARPKVEQRPDEAKFASEFNAKTEKETRARQDAALPLNVTAAPKVGAKKKVQQKPAQKMAALVDKSRSAAGKPTEKVGQGRAGKIAKESQEDSRSFVFQFSRQRSRPFLDIDLQKDAALSQEAPKEERQSDADETKIAMGAKNPEAPSPESGRAGNFVGENLESGGGGEGLPNLAALTPTMSELVDVIGMPARNHLPDLESADSTSLNSWRWQHAPFFNRIRDALYRVWDPHTAISKNDPMAYSVNHQTRQTVLRVTIDLEGNVTDMLVESPSGADYLDREALRAFREGGPFPNPPRDLFEGGEKFSFLFGFSVDGSRSELDFNWKPY